MERHEYHRNSVKVWGQLIVVYTLFMVILVPILFFVASPGNKYDNKMLALMLALIACTWFLTTTTRALLTQTKSILIDSERLSVGSQTWRWTDILECNLHTIRDFGTPGKQRKFSPAVVLVFNDNEEVRIFYTLYAGQEKLIKQIEDIVSTNKPDVIRPLVKVNTDRALICPNCLGKSYLTKNDIARIGHGAVWMPGDCKRCNGSGYIPMP